MTPMHTVRRATPADASALVDLRVAMLSSFFDEVPGGEWRELCRAMDGDLVLEPRGPDGGAAFSIFLPGEHPGEG